MNSSISVSKSLWRKGAAVVLVSVVCLFLFDRLFYLTLAHLAGRFYSKAEVGQDWYGQTEFIRPGFYNALIVGSSRAKEAVMPIYLYNQMGIRAQNNASPGRYPRYHYEHYLRFRKKNGPPQLYIYGLDYFTFTKESNEKQLQGLIGGEKPRKVWNASEMKNPDSSFWSRLSLLYRAKKEIDAFFVDLVDYLSFRFPVRASQDKAPGGISTYRGLYGTVPPENRLRPSDWLKTAYEPLPGVEGEYLVRLLEELRRDRVVVLLLVPPEYIAVYETNHEHERQMEDLRKLENRYQNVFVLDYNNPRVFELDNPALFADGRWGERVSHLSVFGAERLAQMLAQDIPRLMEEYRKRRDG